VPSLRDSVLLVSPSRHFRAGLSHTVAWRLIPGGAGQSELRHPKPASHSPSIDPPVLSMPPLRGWRLVTNANLRHGMRNTWAGRPRPSYRSIQATPAVGFLCRGSHLRLGEYLFGTRRRSGHAAVSHHYPAPKERYVKARHGSAGWGRRTDGLQEQDDFLSAE